MNIGIDIDDTITKTSEETDIYAKEYTESILKRKFEPQNIEIFDRSILVKETLIKK